MAVEAFAVGQSGQRVIHGHVLQPHKRLQPDTAVDQVARQTSAEDQQRHTSHHEGQRLHGRWIGHGMLQQHRRHTEAGHPGEMQRDDGKRQEQRRRTVPSGFSVFVGQLERQRTEAGCQQYRGENVAALPTDQPLHTVGQHAKVVHRRDTQTADRSADGRRQPPARKYRQHQARRSAQHGDQQ